MSAGCVETHVSQYGLFSPYSSTEKTRALLNPAMKFILRGALRAPLKINFIAKISNAKTSMSSEDSETEILEEAEELF
jgi:hypothetical protein